MGRRVRESGLSSYVAGPVGVVPGVAKAARSTSRRTIRPPGAVPLMSAMDRPASLARRRASGLLKMRPPPWVVAEVDGAEADGAISGPTPSSTSRALRSSTSSPGSPSSAIGAPTPTTAPAGTSVLRITPSASAGTSTTAFSVSTVAMASSDLNGVFSGTGHADSTASTELAATSGMRSNRAMSGPRDLGESCGDFCSLGDRRPFQDLADTGRGLATGHSLHGLVKPVEEPVLDLVGEPAAIRRPEGNVLIAEPG